MNSQNNYLIYVVAFLAVFAQASMFGIRYWAAAQVDLLPALMVYTALNAGIVNVACLAVVGGLWFDSLSANPLGITILPLFLPGLILFLQRDLILKELTFAQLIIGGAMSALVPLLSVILLLSAGKPLLLGWGTLWQWLVMAVGGALATPVIFALFKWFNDAFGYKVSSGSSFRPDRELLRGRR
jgi:rod shape-determining protein MreD